MDRCYGSVMLSLERCREILGDEARHLSDSELERVREETYALAKLLIQAYREHKKNTLSSCGDGNVPATHPASSEHRRRRAPTCLLTQKPPPRAPSSRAGTTTPSTRPRELHPRAGTAAVF